MNASTLVTALRNRGFSLRVVNGRLLVSPKARLATDDCKLIRAHLTELLDVIEPDGPPATQPAAGEAAVVLWDADEATRLMHAADDLVTECGVNGAHPEIVAAVAVVASAMQMRDSETFRFALAEFEVAVRHVASS